MHFLAITLAPSYSLGEVGTLLVGTAALGTLLWGVSMAILRAWYTKGKSDLELTMNRAIQSHLLGSIAHLDPAKYYTLDVHFENGQTIIIPMVPFVELTISENLTICVLDQTAEETKLQMRTNNGPASLRRHRHELTCERILVERGTMTDMKTGTIYRKGDMWEIAAGQIHGAWFSDHFLATVLHKPALPTAAQRPVDLRHLEEAMSQ